jgi:TRAP-type transport system small permease protein
MRAPSSGSPARFFFQHFEELIASAALIVVIAAVTWGVITRYVTEQPAAWASEVAMIGFAWVTFFGASACFKYRLHPAIDMLVTRLPAVLRKAVAYLNHILILGFCAFMVYQGGRFALAEWDNPTPVLRVPYTIVFAPVALSFLLMMGRYVQGLRVARPMASDAL